MSGPAIGKRQPGICCCRTGKLASGCAVGYTEIGTNKASAKKRGLRRKSSSRERENGLMRTKLIRRGQALVLAAIVFATCFVMLPASAGDSEEPRMTVREMLLSSYEDTMQVSYGEDGEISLVNGCPVRKVRAAFNNRGSWESFPYEIDFFDYPFMKASTEYDGGLALMSLCMALSANRPYGFDHVAQEDYDAAKNLEIYLEDAGFTHFRKDDYDKIPSMFTISSGMAYRRMEQEDGESFTLIAVGVCGGKYRNEWQSNMTPGSGRIHKGFQSAAQLVYDRLMGYIARENIQGRIKIWITGFSRAAAVSNLTAAMLNNCRSLRREDIYAYTFATPAAVREPPQTGYENIFNCLGPMDLVPQVMPADWGYGRYGTDLFFAEPEWNYDYGVMGSFAREFTADEAFGISNWYNSALNLRLRLLYSMLLDVLDDLDNYNTRFQPVLVGIMQDKTVNNIMQVLRRLMVSLRGSDRTERTDLDTLMDYLVRVVAGSFTGQESGQIINSGSPLMQLFNEHTEDSYFSNALSLLNSYYLENKQFHYVMVRGAAAVRLQDCGSGETLIRIDADGKTVHSAAEASDQLVIWQEFYAERIGNTTVVAVPSDRDFTVIWTAERSGNVQCMQVECDVRARSRYSAAVGPVVAASAGDEGIAYLSKEGKHVLPEGFASETVDAKALTEFLGIASVGVNWRIWIILMCALAGLILFLLIFLILKIAKKNRKNGALFYIAFCLLGIAALESETAYWLFADQPWIRLVWKAVAAICLIFLYFSTRGRRERKGISVFPALVLAVIADMVISLHFLAGTAVFLLCHLALTAGFVRNRKPARKDLILWAVISIPAAVFIVLQFGGTHGTAARAAALYLPVLLLTGFCAKGQSRSMKRAVLLLILSDILLGTYFSILQYPFLHVWYMGLFYAALALMAAGSDRSRERQENSPAGEEMTESGGMREMKQSC